MFFLLAAVATAAVASAETLGSSGSSTLSSSNGSSNYQNPETEAYLAMLNKNLGHNYLWALLVVVVLILGYNSMRNINTHIRRLASLSDGSTQRYFTIASPTVSWIKDHILCAPILHHRRATELRITRHLTLGTLPTRFQAIFLTLVTVFNVFACCWNIPWSDPQLEVLPILRNRTGTLSVVNLIPILAMATIKNPLISVLDISFDTFNLMHRWLGRLSIVQGIAHTLCYIIAKVQKQGWPGVQQSIQHPFIYNGLIATMGFAIIFVQAPKLVRSWAYEAFLHIHFVVAMVTFVFLWMHLDGMPQQHLLLGGIIIWVMARGLRFATLVFRSVGKEVSKATFEAMPGNALRISLTTPRPWTFHPGQSLYLTVPAIGWWTAHPFSVAWSDVEDPLSRSDSVRSEKSEKRLVMKKPAINFEESGKRAFTIIVKARTGMTKKLYDRVQAAGAVDGVKLSLNALIEGPYGREKSLASYGTLVLFASGVGITHQIPYVKDLIEGFQNGTVATRRVMLVWVIPGTECLEWIRPWMHEILGMEKRREMLKVLLYITRAGLSQPIRSPSESVRMLRGRPDVETLMKREANKQVGCMGVSVCAGGGLADEVRRVSRILLGRGINLDFIEEGFGW